MNAGFYKVDGELLYAPITVTGPDWQLVDIDRDQYEYPVDGWYWFDSEDEARSFFLV